MDCEASVTFKITKSGRSCEVTGCTVTDRSGVEGTVVGRRVGVETGSFAQATIAMLTRQTKTIFIN